MKIDYMKEFVALVENLNFRKTADQLFMTQPALSRHIAIIEEIVGARLLIRTKYLVSVTPTGKILYHEFKNILQAFDSALKKSEQLSSGQIGTLKIGVPYYYSEEYIEPIIPLFTKKYPQVKINIVSCQPSGAFDAVVNKQLDLALVQYHPYPNAEEICFFKYAQEKLAVVVPVHHSLANRVDIRLEELRDEIFIFLENKYFTDFIYKLLEAKEVIPKKIVLSEQIETLSLSMNQSNGISIMPYSVRNMIRHNSKVIILADNCNIPMTLAYRTDNYNSCIPLFLKSVYQFFQECRGDEECRGDGVIDNSFTLE